MERSERTPAIPQQRCPTAERVAAAGALATFFDNRPEAAAQRRLMAAIQQSPRVVAQRALNASIHNSPRMVVQRLQLRSLFGEAAQSEAASGQGVTHWPTPGQQRRGPWHARKRCACINQVSPHIPPATRNAPKFSRVVAFAPLKGQDAPNTHLASPPRRFPSPVPSPGTMVCSPQLPPNISPNVVHPHILLMKPGQPFGKPLHSLRSDPQPRGGKRIAQEVQAPFDPAVESLVRVLGKLEFGQYLIDPPDRRARLSAHGWRPTLLDYHRDFVKARLTKRPNAGQPRGGRLTDYTSTSRLS